MESSVEMVRRRLRKVWKIWWWSAEEDETVSLIDDSSATLKSVQVESSVSQQEPNGEKKKSWRKEDAKIGAKHV